MNLMVSAVAAAAVAGLLCWWAAKRWWHYLAIAALAVPLFPLVANGPTGDVSRYLPHDAFTGKDDVAVASALATLLAAISLAALAVLAVRHGVRLVRRGRSHRR